MICSFESRESMGSILAAAVEIGDGPDAQPPSRTSDPESLSAQLEQGTP